MKFKIYPLLCFLFLVNLVHAQEPGFGAATQGAFSQLNIPQLYDEKMNGEMNTTNVEFLAYPYQSSKIDLRDIKKRYPQLVIEDFIQIVPPILNGFNDETIVMGIIDKHLGSEAGLIIWIAGNYESNKVTFFIDENGDRNFLNDKKPMVVKGGRSPKSVEVFPYGKNNASRQLFVAVPKKAVTKKKRIKRLEKSKAKMLNNFSIGLLTQLGTAKLHHEYIKTKDNFPAWYDVNISEKQIGLTANYSLQSFRFGAIGTYQNIFQYTSYFKDRFAEPEIINQGGSRIFRENIAEDPNRDIHSQHRFRLGLNAAYRLHLSRYSEFQPTIEAGAIYHGNGKYIANKHVEPQLAYDQVFSPFISYGGRFEFATGHHRTLAIGVMFGKVIWEPDGYFESFEGTEIQKSYNNWSIDIGYHFGF